MKRHRFSKLLIGFIIAWLLLRLSSCASGSKFYEVTDRQIAYKKGYLFKFKLNEYRNDHFMREITFYSSANWEVTDIINTLRHED